MKIPYLYASSTVCGVQEKKKNWKHCSPTLTPGDTLP